FLVGRGDAVLRVRAEEAILVQLETQTLGPSAQLRVVTLRAREVLERRSELLVRDDPQVGRETVCQSDGRLRLARADHLCHAELVAKGFRKSARVLRRGHEVD